MRFGFGLGLARQGVGASLPWNVLEPTPAMLTKQGSIATIPFDDLNWNWLTYVHTMNSINNKIFAINNDPSDQNIAYLTRFNDKTDFADLDFIKLEDAVEQKYSGAIGAMPRHAGTNTLFITSKSATTLYVWEIDDAHAALADCFNLVYSENLTEIAGELNETIVGNYLYVGVSYKITGTTYHKFKKLDIVNRTDSMLNLIGTYDAGHSDKHTMCNDGTYIYYGQSYLNIYNATTDTFIQTIDIAARLGHQYISMTDDSCCLGGYAWFGDESSLDEPNNGKYLNIWGYNIATDTVLPITSNFIQALTGGEIYNQPVGKQAYCFGVFTDGTYLYCCMWSDNKSILIINPASKTKYICTLEDYNVLTTNELVFLSDGTFVTGKWTSVEQYYYNFLIYGEYDTKYLFQMQRFSNFGT